MIATRSASRLKFVAGSAAVLSGISVVQAPAKPAQFSWRCGSGNSASVPLNVRLVEAFGKIRAETNGQLDVKHYPDAALGSDPSMISQIRLGALDMMAEAGGQLDGLVPLAAIENAPFAFPNYETAWRAFDGEVGKLVRNGLSTIGLHIFERPFDNGFRQFTTSSRPVRVVDDLQGMRIRVPTSRFRVDVFRSLGAAPTPFVYSELYMALQTKLVEGEETPLVFVEGDKFYEVQKYCSLTNHMWGAFWILVNKAKWDSLPPHFQDIMTKHINATALLQRRDDQRLDVTLIDKLTRRGMIINKAESTTFRARLKSTGFYSRWKAEWGATAWDALEQYSGPLS